MDYYAKINDIAEGEIESLKALGIEPTPAEIIEINYLAWQIENPTARSELSKGTPVFAGDTPLWPLTMRANDWIDKVGNNLPTYFLRNYACAYAMANCYSDNNPFDIGITKAIGKVISFYLNLNCNSKTLQVAMLQVLEQSDDYELPPQPESKKQKSASIGEISAFLAANTGTSVEFWEDRCTTDYAYGVINTIVQQNKVDDRPCDTDPKILATIALGWCVLKIRERHTENG